MSRNSYGDPLRDYAEQLLANYDSPRPSVHSAVVWAYQSPMVRDAIAARLEAGQVLIAANPIIPDKMLRRERVYFSFAYHNRLDAQIPGILVQVGDNNEVAEVVDPFSPEDWADVPAASLNSTLPLAAVSSAISDFDERVRYDEKWHNFVTRSRLSNFFPGGPMAGAWDINHTICGGRETRSDVMSSFGSKEDPDPDTTGGRFDDCGMF